LERREQAQVTFIPQEPAVRRGADATLSIVVPLFNEADNVGELLRRIIQVVRGLSDPPADYEVILVDDGSRDATLEKLLDAAHGDPHLRVISLSRNFGHQIAATAGLDAARGDAVVLMDGDLQDPPELIDGFLAKFREGYDVVYATRRRRAGESRFKLFTAAMFYRIIRRLTNVSIPVDTGDFRLMSRRVVDALRRSPERNRFLRGMVSWVGFNQTAIEYDRDVRYAGATKYPLGKMIRFAMDGIASFSDVPLRFASYFGFTVSAIAFIYAIIVVAFKLFSLKPPGYTPGWASTIVAILFLGGVQLMSLGILGEYLGRVYDEVKGRPLYLISDIERS
jgi:dolichol-phosphate mannosyltransferase